MAPGSDRPLRVVQVSDCHLPADPATLYRGLNADRTLASLLPAIRRWQPDLLLLTGDVSEDGSAAAYGRASAALSTVGAPVLALPGNHDAPEVMARFFPMGPWAGPLCHRARGWQLLLLDSTEAGRVGGILPPETLHSAQAELSRAHATHVLVALHHQPVPMGAEWIDRYALEEPAAFRGWVESQPRVRCVTWGHVHQDFESMESGVLWLGSPSTVANSLPRSERFTLDLSGPACRWLELDGNGGVRTGLLHAGAGDSAAQSFARGSTSQRIR